MSRRWSIRMLAAVCTAMVFLMSCGQQVYASEAKVLSARTSDNLLYLYVRDASADDGVSVQIAGTVIGTDDICSEPLQELEIPMRTVILLDNSLSIPESDRTGILEILSGLIAGKMEGEQLRIGTYSDEITWLCDYTSDEAVLLTAAEGIVYKKQSAHLGSILYELIGELAGEEAETYTRILVFTDGADDQSIGYTEEEVSTALAESGIPVYSIGVRLSDNSSELETLFSYSRASSAEYFLLDEFSAEELVEELQADQNSLRISVALDESMLDGAARSVRLQLGSGDETAEMTLSVTMPFGSLMAGSELDAGTESDAEQDGETGDYEASAAEADTASDDVPDSMIIRMRQILPFVAGAAAAAVAAGIAAAALLRKRKKGAANSRKDCGESEDLMRNGLRRENAAAEESRRSAKTGPEGAGIMPAEETVYEFEENGEETVLMGSGAGPDPGSDRDYLILTNLEQPELRYKCSLRDSIVVGRRDTDIVIEGDPEVSRTHCRFELRGSSLYLEDCGSRNGTTYEGRRLLQGQKMRISVGGRVKIGRYTYAADLMQRR